MRDELQQLPGVGPSIAADLRRLGVKSIRDLARRIRSGCMRGCARSPAPDRTRVCSTRFGVRCTRRGRKAGARAAEVVEVEGT